MKDFFSKYNSNYKFLSIQFILLFFLFNFLFTDFYCRKDLSRENRFNLTESTEKTFQNLPEKLFIDAFYSTDIPGEHKARLNLTKELIKEMANINRSKVELRFYDPDSSEANKKRTEEAGIKAVTLEKQDRNSASIKQAYFGLKLTVGAKSTVIPVAYMAESLEYQVLSSLKKMLSKTQNSSMAVIKANGIFLSPDPNQGGAGIGKDSYGVFIHYAYSQENGSVPEINVNEEPITDDVKTLFWVGSPELSDKGKYHIDQFLMRGGNLVIFQKVFNFSLGGGRQQQFMNQSQDGIASPDAQVPAINNFLSSYGFKFNVDMILEPNESYSVMDIFQKLQNPNATAYHYPLWILATSESSMLNKDSLFTKNSKAILLPWSSSIELVADKQKEAKFTKLVESTKEADRRENFVLVSEDKVAAAKIEAKNQNYLLGLHVEGKLNSSFTKETIPTGSTEVFIDKTKEGKTSNILVFGSPYILSDLLAQDNYVQMYKKHNLSFALNLFDILNGDTDLLATRTKQSYTKNLKDASKGEKIFWNFVNILLIPIGVAVFAVFRLKKRTIGAVK